MEILENFVKSDGIDINALFPVDKLARVKPEATARNDAALTALLDPGESPVDTYKMLYDEALRGSDELAKRKGDAILQRNRASDNQIAFEILGDTSLSDAQKQTALAYLQQHEPSLAEVFSTRIAAEEPVSGNKKDDAVKEVARNYLSEELAYKQAAQAVENNEAARLDPAISEFAMGMGEAFIPGSITAQAVGTLQTVQKELGINPSLIEKVSVAAAKKNIIKFLDALPPKEREEKLRNLGKAINENSGLILRDKNDVEAANLLQQLVGGEYSTSTAVADSVFQVLDLIGVGGLAKNVFKGSYKAIKAIPLLNKKPAPLSPVSLAVGANQDKARGMYQAITESSTDEVAGALAGTSKTDVVLHTEGTKPLSPVVENNIVKPSEAASQVEELRNLTRQGAIWLDDKEYAAAVTSLTKRFQDIHGVSQWDNFTQYGTEGQDLIIRSVYGNGDTGFLTVNDAVETAKYQFKDFGVLDDDIKILSRNPEGNYVPVELKDVNGVAGDYLVQLEFRTPITTSEFTPLVTKYNAPDRIPFLRSRVTGSLSRNLFDAASILPKNISGSMEVAIDASTKLDKHIIALADDYAKQRGMLSSQQQAALEQVIKKSDELQTHFPDSVLKGQYGLSDESITALKKWREAWDTHHWLSNLTNIKSMRNAGFMRLENANAQLFGKKIAKNTGLGKMYDPDLDVVRKFTQKEIDDLYDSGGSIAMLKNKEVINGESVSHFVTTNQPGNYLRALRDSDQVINYIPGYFHRYYKSPRFVVKNMKDADGESYEQAVAVAKTWKEAQRYIEKEAQALGISPEAYGRVRGDVKDVLPGSIEDWQLRTTAGHVNQRHRGKILQNSNGPVHLGDTDFVLNPMESLIRSASNVSRKVALQDVIDTHKARLMTEFKDLMPKDGSYPTSWNQIGKMGDMSSTEAKNARALWDYIDQMEIGLIEGIDAMTKLTFNALADQLGKAGWTKSERASLAAGRLNPMTSISSFTHSALIKWAPLRQWIVQPSQSLQLAAYNLSAFIKTLDDLGNLNIITMKKMTGKALSPAEKEIDDFVRSWGGFSGVDRQLLVDGPLRELVQNENAILRGLGNIDKAVGKVGFDSAEKLNLLTHLLTVRNKYISLGKDITDLRVIDEIRSETRALTLSMNEAGAMPYNKTSPALFMKFLQVPHKGILKITTNQRLSTAEKLRIGAFEAMLYGVPIATVAEFMDKDLLSDNPEVREVQLFGALTWAYNELWQQLAGKDPKINFQSIGPYETDGWRKLITNFSEGGFAKMLASTPSGSLVMGSNPRLTNAIQKSVAFMGMGDYSKSPPELMEVFQSWARLSSGANAAMNYAYIVNANKELNRRGTRIREDVDNWTALHELFGMQTTPESASYEVMRKATERKKERTDDVKKHVDFILENLRDRYNEEGGNVDMLMRTLQEINVTFADDPYALEVAHKHMIERANTSDEWFFDFLFKYAGILSVNEMTTYLKSSGMPEEQIKKNIDIYQHMMDKQTNDEIDKAIDKGSK